MRYNIFAGTNTGAECRVALQGLLGRLPLTDGPDISKYERRFAEAVGSKHAFSFASGRMALYTILQALGIGPGDEVIIPALTCVVVPNAIIYRGAMPIYVDIDPRSFNVDVSKLEAKITSRTRAVLAQHTFGLPCDVDGIRAIALRHGIMVIEDCAHALGAEYKGAKVGSLANAAFFSTDHSKMISTSTGGIITTSDDALARSIAKIYSETAFLSRSRIRKILVSFVLEHFLFDPRVCQVGTVMHRALNKLSLLAYFDDELKLTRPTAYPYPARLSNVQARIGLSQLALLQHNLAHRRQLARSYEAEIGWYAGWLDSSASEHSWLRYTFLVDSPNKWQQHFGRVLEMGVWFTSVTHGRTERMHEVDYTTGTCPLAERVTRHCINLPTHPRITHPALIAGLVGTALRAGLRVLPHSAWHDEALAVSA